MSSKPKSVTLFNGTPFGTVAVVVCSLCPRELLETCNVPQRARTQVPNMTKGTMIEDETVIFVRGVNSCFYKVKLQHTSEEVYVHEHLVRRDS